MPNNTPRKGTATRKTTVTRKTNTETLVQRVLDTIEENALHRPRGWDRTWLVRFFIETWPTLPEYRRSQISSTARVRSEHVGERIPDECFTRDIDLSQNQTIRAYIKNVVLRAMVMAGIDAPEMDQVMTPIEYDKHGVAYVAIYRIK